MLQHVPTSRTELQLVSRLTCVDRLYGIRVYQISFSHSLLYTKQLLVPDSRFATDVNQKLVPRYLLHRETILSGT